MNKHEVFFGLLTEKKQLFPESTEEKTVNSYVFKVIKNPKQEKRRVTLIKIKAENFPILMKEIEERFFEIAATGIRCPFVNNGEGKTDSTKKQFTPLTGENLETIKAKVAKIILWSKEQKNDKKELQEVS